MGSLLQAKIGKSAGRKTFSQKKSKAERLGWHLMSEGKKVSFRSMTLEVRSTDISQLPEPYAACPKLL